MTAGLPGTGIGGLFYLLLIAFMPLRELALRLRGRRSAGGARTIVVQYLLALGILVALSIEAWLLVGVVSAHVGPPGSAARALATEQAARTATYAALGSLALALFTLALLRLFARRAPAPTCCAIAPR